MESRDTPMTTERLPLTDVRGLSPVCSIVRQPPLDHIRRARGSGNVVGESIGGEVRPAGADQRSDPATSGNVDHVLHDGRGRRSGGCRS